MHTQKHCSLESIMAFLPLHLKNLTCASKGFEIVSHGLFVITKKTRDKQVFSHLNYTVK